MYVLQVDDAANIVLSFWITFMYTECLWSLSSLSILDIVQNYKKSWNTVQEATFFKKVEEISLRGCLQLKILK